MKFRGRSLALGMLKAALAIAAVGLAGCGSDATSADDFVGAWHYLDEKSTVQCLNADPHEEPPAPNKIFGRGVSSALVDLSPSPLGLDSGVVCDFGFDVAGLVATTEDKQTCAIDPVDTLTIDDDATTGKPLWTFTLNSATTAEELVTGTIHITLPSSTVGGNPVQQTCAWTLVGHLARLTKD
jgi:hypothetical protein